MLSLQWLHIIRHCCSHPPGSASNTAADAPAAPANPMLMSAVGALFGFKPFFNMATKKARGMIVERAKSLGLDWDGAMRDMQAQDWEARLQVRLCRRGGREGHPWHEHFSYIYDGEVEGATGRLHARGKLKVDLAQAI